MAGRRRQIAATPPPRQLRGRLAATGYATRDATEERKLRSTVDSLADDLLCPITRQLPVDPVTAEDGGVYERAAIEEHIQSSYNHGPELRSPITNELMVTN